MNSLEYNFCWARVPKKEANFSLIYCVQFNINRSSWHNILLLISTTKCKKNLDEIAKQNDNALAATVLLQKHACI
jgi:hypothetical protein